MPLVFPVACCLWPVAFSIPPCLRSSLSVLSGKGFGLMLIFPFDFLRASAPEPALEVSAEGWWVLIWLLVSSSCPLFPVPYSLALSNNRRPAASLYDVLPD